jgi:hypothetical protein
MDMRAKFFLMIGLLGLAVGGYIVLLMMYLDPSAVQDSALLTDT